MTGFTPFTNRWLFMLYHCASLFIVIAVVVVVCNSTGKIRCQPAASFMLHLHKFAGSCDGRYRTQNTFRNYRPKPERRGNVLSSAVHGCYSSLLLSSSFIYFAINWVNIIEHLYSPQVVEKYTKQKIQTNKQYTLYSRVTYVYFYVIYSKLINCEGSWELECF